MKRNHIYILFMLLAISLIACRKKLPQDNPHNRHGDTEHMQHSSSGHKTVYTCPMHPEVVKDKPGACPVCGMDLVEKKEEGTTTSNNDLELLLKPSNEYAFSQVKSVSPSKENIPAEITANGRATYDTRQINTVSARVSGRVEKLYIKYQYQPIAEGQPLMDIYSKELVTEQENYLYVLKNDSTNHTLLKTAENRLLLQGLHKTQIDMLRKTGKVIQYITIYSPYTGHLHELNDMDNASDPSMAATNATSQEISIKQGMYVEKGQVMFNIYNTKKLWVVLDIYPEDMAFIKKGQKTRLHINGIDEEIMAQIDFIEPVIEKGHQTARVRVYIANANNKIKIGALVKATISAGTKTALMIPSTAIVHLGINDVVFIKEGNAFRAKYIQTGMKTGNQTEIISGISDLDEIAENAQFLIDSESFIKVYNP